MESFRPVWISRRRAATCKCLGIARGPVVVDDGLSVTIDWLAATSADSVPVWCIDFLANGSPERAYIARSDFEQMIDKAATDWDWRALSVDVFPIVVEHFASSHLRHLEKTFACSIEVTGMALDEMPAWGPFVRFRIRSPAGECDLFLSDNSTCLPLVLKVYDAQAVARRSIPDLRIDVPVQIGGCVLSLAELSELTVGDVIVLPVARQPTMPVEIMIGGRQAAASWTGDKIGFSGSWRRVPKCYGAEGSGSLDNERESGATGIEEIPVPVTLEIGKVRLTVKEIETIRSGFIVDLDRTPDQLVDIVANGVSFAKAEIVEVEGKLAVRVTSVKT